MRGYLTWDAFYAVALLACLVFVLTLDDPTAHSPALAVCALLGGAGWYVTYGRRLMRTAQAAAGTGTGRPGGVYLAALLALFTAAVVLAPAASLALVIVVPQVYWTLRPVPATAAVVGFALVPLVVEAVRTGSLSAGVAAQGPTALLVIAFSVLCGTWVHRIIDQSAERAALIEELTATRSELAAAAERAGIAAERERLAGEIHDAIAQGLSSIVMLTQATASTLSRMGELPPTNARLTTQAREQLDLVARTARESLAEAGALVEALRPTALDTAASLPEALRRLTAHAAEGTPLTTTFTLNGCAEPLPVALEVVLLRTTQEALSNVRQHARATRADVSLTYTHTHASVEIRDDGTGLSAPPDDSPGYGLSGMLRRAEQVGGTRKLTSAPGRGTTLHVEVPR
ncbi:two-component sensor histidine kinase [Streptomyces spiroverticillatus]|uniref:Oxygen sensor histidine kinase NreB n=1 Tax=Streptomyces finlayi TaxID=67296 RepID=A0A918WWY0_9ACTN|nr:two-component sensor histidine kinase [Streptomyces spiroverticillatus]GHC91553.1 two-component sensor histidine kinase [Streptomyces finlayi]